MNSLRFLERLLIWDGESTEKSRIICFVTRCCQCRRRGNNEKSATGASGNHGFISGSPRGRRRIRPSEPTRPRRPLVGERARVAPRQHAVTAATHHHTDPLRGERSLFAKTPIQARRQLRLRSVAVLRAMELQLLVRPAATAPSSARARPSLRLPAPAAGPSRPRRPGFPTLRAAAAAAAAIAAEPVRGLSRRVCSYRLLLL